MFKEFIGKKVLVRTYSAGVHFGLLVAKEGKEVLLEDSIRIWYWDGAASLSQLSQEGTKKPENCKFGVPQRKLLLTEAIEIALCSEAAIASIEGVPSWKA